MLSCRAGGPGCDFAVASVSVRGSCGVSIADLLWDLMGDRLPARVTDVGQEETAVTRADFDGSDPKRPLVLGHRGEGEVTFARTGDRLTITRGRIGGFEGAYLALLLTLLSAVAVFGWVMLAVVVQHLVTNPAGGILVAVALVSSFSVGFSAASVFLLSMVFPRRFELDLSTGRYRFRHGLIPTWGRLAGWGAGSHELILRVYLHGRNDWGYSARIPGVRAFGLPFSCVPYCTMGARDRAVSRANRIQDWLCAEVDPEALTARIDAG